MTDIPLTKSELARSLGIKRQTINSWIKKGDLVFDESGKMSLDEFDRQLGSKLHPVSKIEKYKPLHENVKDDVEESKLDYHTARTIREIAEAKTAEFKLSILKNEHVEMELVEKIIFERGRQFRDGLTALSKSISPVLAVESDIVKIEHKLADEFLKILDEFTRLPIIK